MAEYEGEPIYQMAITESGMVPRKVGGFKDFEHFLTLLREAVTSFPNAHIVVATVRYGPTVDFSSAKEMLDIEEAFVRALRGPCKARPK